MKWLTKRKLSALLKASDKPLLTRAHEALQHPGLKGWKTTEPFFYSDMVMTYHQHQKDGLSDQIEGLDDLYESLVRKGGDKCRVHAFVDGDISWSIVTDEKNSLVYGVTSVKGKLKIKKKEEVKNTLNRYSASYKLKAFAEGELLGAFEEALSLCGASESPVFTGLYPTYDPGGARQAKAQEEIADFTAINKSPTGLEATSGEILIKVSGTGNRITLVVQAPESVSVEPAVKALETTLGLEASEFAY